MPEKRHRFSLSRQALLPFSEINTSRADTLSRLRPLPPSPCSSRSRSSPPPRRTRFSNELHHRPPSSSSHSPSPRPPQHWAAPPPPRTSCSSTFSSSFGLSSASSSSFLCYTPSPARRASHSIPPSLISDLVTLMVESIPGPGLITMPKALTRAENRQEHIMGKLRDDVLENLLGMERFKKVNPVELKTHIEKRLHEFFLSFHTPTHPPYASMIRMAILELNEKGGLSEEAISAFIRREYKGLPWGHDSFLSHYLGKLCGDLDLEKSNDGRYMLPLKNGDSGNIMKRGRKRLRCKGRQGKDKDRNESEELSILVEDVLQESSGSNRQQFEVTTNGEATGQPENAEELRRKRIKSKAEQNKVSEERHKVEMQPIEATEQRIEGNYDHSVFVMERRKECLDEDDGKEIEEEKQQPHMLEDNLVGEQGLIEEQQMDASDQILTSCCDDKGNNGANSRVQSEESSLLVMEAEKHDFSKQEDQPHSKLRPQRSVTRLCPSKISGSSELLEYAEQHSEMCGKERPRQHFCELQQKPKRRGRGRPPKLKPHEDVILGAHLLPNNRYDNEEEQQLEVQASGACPKSNVEADSIMVPSTQSASDGNHDEQSQKQPQQPQVRRRGRPPKLKAKGTTATTLDASLRTSCGEQQQQQAPRRRGRPPKEKKYSL